MSLMTNLHKMTKVHRINIEKSKHNSSTSTGEKERRKKGEERIKSHLCMNSDILEAKGGGKLQQLERKKREGGKSLRLTPLSPSSLLLPEQHVCSLSLSCWPVQTERGREAGCGRMMACLGR